MSLPISILDVPKKRHVKVVYISGEIDDSNLPELKKNLHPLTTAPGVTAVIFHLEDLQFINSKVIQYFAEFYTDLHENGKKMILSEGNDHILDILNLVGFTSLVEHFTDLDEAIKSINL